MRSIDRRFSEGDCNGEKSGGYFHPSWHCFRVMGSLLHIECITHPLDSIVKQTRMFFRLRRKKALVLHNSSRSDGRLIITSQTSSAKNAHRKPFTIWVQLSDLFMKCRHMEWARSHILALVNFYLLHASLFALSIRPATTKRRSESNVVWGFP